MKTVSQIKFENLCLKDKVKLIKSGTEGHISELTTTEEYPSDEENTVTIDWNNGNVSYIIYHSWLDKVEYVGRNGFSG